MELEALEGAKDTIARSHPIFLVESIKAGAATRLRAFFEVHGLQDRRCRHQSAGDPQERSGRNELQVPDVPAQSSAA